MDQRQLGSQGPMVSTIGFGAFKIGRNEGTKYGLAYPLPDEAEVSRLLNGALDLGINYIDTAPAYGLSEERIGRAIAHRRAEFVLSTKVGEVFEQGVSTYDFSQSAIEQSVERSLRRLQTDVLDVVFLHANREDVALQQETHAVETLQRLRERGLVKQIGLSAKTGAGAQLALAWADVLMIEYHMADQSSEPAITAAQLAGKGVVVKKALASGHLPAAEGLRFVLGHPGVSTVVIGTLNADHLRSNLEVAQCRS